MKKKIIALLLTGVMVISAGCTANVSVDPDTGVVKVDGEPLNEYIADMDLDELSSGSEKDAKKEEDKEKDKEKEDKEKEDSDKDSSEAVEYDGGIKITYPEEFEDTKGIFDAYSMNWQPGEGLFLTQFSYYGVTEDWYDKNINVDEPDPEASEEFRKANAVLTYVFAIDGNRGPDELYDYLMDIADDTDELSKKDFKEIGKAGEWTFYRMSTYDKEFEENLDKDFKEEFETLYDKLDEIFENAEYFEPEDAYRDIVGKKVKFKTTDIDGNEITSEEIFSKNKYTMVNVWATWCGNCINELSELNELNESLEKKDCGIIGLLGDGTDKDTIKEGKDLIKEHGVEYLNILPWDGALEDDLPIAEGWPTSFFVDSEGTIAAMPITGAYIDLYKDTFNELLNGKEDSDKEASEKEEKVSPVTPNDLKKYRVFVSDTDGESVEGVMVQFCDDTSCRVQTTDKEGMVEFKTDKADYTVHVLNQPKGYKKDTKEYKVPDEYSDLHIVLEKE